MAYKNHLKILHPPIRHVRFNDDPETDWKAENVLYEQSRRRENRKFYIVLSFLREYSFAVEYPLDVVDAVHPDGRLLVSQEALEKFWRSRNKDVRSCYDCLFDFRENPFFVPKTKPYEKKGLPHRFPPYKFDDSWMYLPVGTEANKKRIKCVETGEIFSSITDLVRDKGVSRSNIVRVLGKKNLTAYGCHWVRIDK